MKKILLVCLLAMLSIAGYAEEAKKVAILEVVDKEGKLAYSQKLMLRSNLARAITNTDGFEAFDRSDIDEIFKEFYDWVEDSMEIRDKPYIRVIAVFQGVKA